ncbi:MAG: hypothetical protein FWG42_00410 [Clostridiales bacterium]|nr:hypothetical protein [Clostridiales bacterium]
MKIEQKIAQIVFGEIFPYRKFKYGKYDFNYEQYVNETHVGGMGGGVRLHIVTGASDYYHSLEEKLLIDSQANFEAIALLSGQTSCFEDSCQAEKIGSMIENAVFYVYGEKIEMQGGSAASKLSTAMKLLIEGAYSKLNLVNAFSEGDKDVLRMLGDEPKQISMPGTGADNEYALDEIYQWIKQQTEDHLLASVSSIQRRYQSIPYGWREVDIAALLAKLIAKQQVTLRYNGTVMAKNDVRIVDCLRKQPETDKAFVVRRITLPDDLLQRAAAFMSDWFGITDMAKDADGLVSFLTETLEHKLHYCQNLLQHEYSKSSYPEKEAVATVCSLVKDILSQQKDNAAFLQRLLDKQADIRSSFTDMEAAETFFDPKSQQKAVFDTAQQLVERMQNERGYFAMDTGTIEKASEIKSILAMPKPYGRMKDLAELATSVRKAYEMLLEQKKSEVRGLITQCMGDVHTLAGISSKTREEVTRSDGRFDEYKQKAASAASLTALDAITTQLLNYRDTVCKQLEASLRESAVPYRTKDGVSQKLQKVVQIRRYDIFPVKRLQNREDVDNYLDITRKKLYDALEGNDGIQIT